MYQRKVELADLLAGVPFEVNYNSAQAAGLVACWPVGYNPTLISAGSNPVRGTLGGTVSWAASQMGPVLYFPSATAADRVALSGTPSLAGEMTVSAWVYALGFPAVNNFFAGDYSAAGTATQWSAIITNGGRLRFGHANISVLGNKVHAANAWYHVAGVRSGVTGAWTWTCYSNGQYDNTLNTATNPSAQQGAAIGGPGLYVAGDLTWYGYLTDVRLYARALSAAEIYQMYDPATRWELYRPLRRYWQGGVTGVNIAAVAATATGAGVAGSVGLTVVSLPLFDKLLGDVLFHGHSEEAHGTQHRAGGVDPLKLDDLYAPDDTTDLNATTSAHGLLPKGDDTAAHFLRGDVSWATPDHGSLGGLTDYADHAGYLMLDGTRALTANWDAGSFKITAETLASDVATGAAPLTVASTTVVTNLNADTVDGSHAAAFLALVGGTMTGALVLATGTTALLPLKFVSGPLLTAAVAGGIEFLTDDFYATITTGAARQKVVLTAGLTATRVPYATTNGRLTDAAGFTFDGTILTASSYVSSVAIGTAPYACTSTTVNTNLNADMLDGYHVGTSGSTVPLLDGANTWSGAQTLGTTTTLYLRDSALGIYSQADTFIDIFADGGLRIGDSSGGAPTNYLLVKPDGEINLAGTARAWKSQDLKPESVKLPAANPPAVDEYGGFSFDRFDRGTEEQVYYMWHIPNDYAAGDASVKGHYGFFVENPPAAETADENVRLGFEYKKISDGNVFSFASGTSSGYLDETIAQGEAAYTWHETAVGTCTTTGWVAGDTVLFRFYRDATAVEDTYDNEASAADNDVWIGVYHLQYLVDKLGTAS